MASLLCILLATAVVFIATYLYNTFTYWKRRGVLHEKPLPVLGNMKGIGRSLHLRDVNGRIYERFKNESPIAGLYFFFTRNVLIMDLDLVKNILIKDFANFHDRNGFCNVRDEPLMGHLLLLKGQQWTAMRHKLTPTFTSGKMKYMFNTVAAVSENLVRTCKDFTKADQVIEIKELSARYTTDIIGTCAFGIECNSLNNPDAEFRRYGRAIFDKPRHNAFVQLFMITNPEMARRMRLKMLPDKVSRFFMDVVRETVEYRVKHGVKRYDFMDLLIEMMAKDQKAAREGGGVDLSMGLTLEQMAAQAFIFFLAGFDTSSTTISFTIYELALASDIQEKLRDEIATVLQQHDNKLSYEALMEMKYLDQVISETLRKYPVLAMLTRQAINDYKVPNSSYVIPKAASIVIPLHAIHHDPQLYPDPERYDPSRFEEDQVKARHPFAYLPFGDGPRNCIGLRFGKMQTKMGVLSLIRSFKFSPTEKTENPLELDIAKFLTTSRNPIYLRAEPI